MGGGGVVLMDGVTVALGSRRRGACPGAGPCSKETARLDRTLFTYGVSAFISRNIGEAPFFRQIGSYLTAFLQVWSYRSPGIFDDN